LSDPNVSRRVFSGFALAVALAPHAAQSSGEYPTRPVRLLVPSVPGSSPDVIARLIAADMSTRFKHPLLVENRAGASSIIGINAVAKAAPDGYTLGYVTPTLVLNRVLRLPLPFDADRDLHPVIQFGAQPVVLVVAAASRHRNVAQLMEEARLASGRLSYASTGLGSIFHLSAELLRLHANVGFVHVPYTSGPQAITDLVGNRVDFMFNALNVVLPHVRSGQLRALGVSSLQRSATMPDVPTLAEQGLRLPEVMTWGGMVAPADTPADILELLNESANAALVAPAVRQVLTDSGYEIVGGSAARFKAFLRSELEKWGEVVNRIGPLPR
jgi:tripartite-type tricarboxylate transporter receptor subunit TctC